MDNLTKIELENIKILIENYETFYKKIKMYHGQVSDPQIKHIFKNIAQNLLNIRQKLISILNG